MKIKSRQFRYKRSIQVLFLIGMITLGLACGLLGGSEMKADRFCKKSYELQNKGGSTKRCVKELLKINKKSPKIFKCQIRCLDDSTADYRTLNKCSKDCIDNKGAKSLKTVLQAKVEGSTVTVTINSTPGAKLIAFLQNSQISTRKLKNQKVVADKSGLATVSFTRLRSKSYYVEVLSSKDSLRGKGVVGFRIKASRLDLKARAKKSGDIVHSCKLNLMNNKHHKIPANSLSAQVPFDSKGKSSLTLSMGGAQTFTYNGKKQSFKSNQLSLSLDLKKIMIRHTAKNIFSAPKAEAPIALKHESRGNYRGKISCTLGKVSSYKKAKPFTFTGDRKSKSGKQVAILLKRLKRKTSVKRVIGDADTLAKDVDYFVESKSEYKDVGSCPYVGSKSKMKKNIKKTVVNQNLTIYNRRTGQAITSKFFKGRKPSCPATLSSARKGVYGEINSSAVNSWVKNIMASQD